MGSPSFLSLGRGIDSVMRGAFEFLDDGTDAIYVSVDIDVVDGGRIHLWNP